MAGGNLHLPRLATRGVVEPKGKVKREPKRYAVADRRVERAGPAIETLRGPVHCETIDLDNYPVPVRAVLDARPATCRYPFGQLEHLTYCGAKATVAVAGALTYCSACAKRMGFDLAAWRRAQNAVEALHGRKR